MSDTIERDHALKNYLAIILGFTEILMLESSADDPRREDFEEIHKAATAAVKVMDGKEPEP
jgi:hypothetical protein